LKITKLINNTLQQRLVFLLVNEETDKRTHDDFYIPLPEDNTACPADVMWDTKRVPTCFSPTLNFFLRAKRNTQKLYLK